MDLPRTKEQLERILLDNMQKILNSGVTRKALRDPSKMTFEDIIANLHLCERLSNAHGALAALNGYGDPDNRFVLRD